MLDSPKKKKRQFPYNREVYRLSVLLASDIVKHVSEGKMSNDLSPDFIKAQKLAIRDIMNMTGMTLKQTGDYLKDFCVYWTLDVVPVFPDENEEEVSTEQNPVAAEIFDALVAFAVEGFMEKS